MGGMGIMGRYGECGVGVGRLGEPPHLGWWGFFGVGFSLLWGPGAAGCGCSSVSRARLTKDVGWSGGMACRMRVNLA